MHRIQIVVVHTGHRIRYYPVPEGESWKVDPEWRQIIIGVGVPRTCIPLDNVVSYSIEYLGDPNAA